MVRELKLGFFVCLFVCLFFCFFFCRDGDVLALRQENEDLRVSLKVGSNSVLRIYEANFCAA